MSFSFLMLSHLQGSGSRKQHDLHADHAGSIRSDFLLYDPASTTKRAKEHKKLMDSIGKGDEVLTSGGFIGRVTKVAETGYVVIALNDTTEVMIKRDFVAAVLPKGTMKAL